MEMKIKIYQNYTKNFLALKNNDLKVYNSEGETDDVHAFSKEWSKWLTKGKKIYSKKSKKKE